MSQELPPRKVTVEDLLRVKRAERPPPAFWAGFEKELRAKQLAAIVAKRPWWSGASMSFSRLSRLRFPLGAASACALAFLAVQQFRLAGPAVAVDSAAKPVAPAHAFVIVDRAPVQADVDSDSDADVAPQPVVAMAAPAEPSRPAVSNVSPGEIAQFISMMGADPARKEQLQPHRTSPSALVVAANLAAAQESENEDRPAVANVGFESRGFPSRGLAEPLAQVPTPRDAYRARYIGTALPTSYALESASARPANNRSSDTGRSRLNERQLYDTVSRVGFTEGGVSIKLF
jgi:hypothetical protein